MKKEYPLFVSTLVIFFGMITFYRVFGIIKAVIIALNMDMAFALSSKSHFTIKKRNHRRFLL